jgi:AraC-like DNA-binding protein
MNSDPEKYDLLNNINAQKTETREEILSRLLLGKDFIDSCFLLNPDIKSIARECNMSEFHFYRCFKQVFGITPYQYILSRRLEYAKELLHDTGLRITAIAEQCSFRDVFTFSKAFKRKYGSSPSKRRRE